MVRDFNKEYFSTCSSNLAKQNTEISTMKQSLFSAVSSENTCEFKDGVLISKYNEIESLLTQKRNNNIEYLISLGKKSTSLYNADTQSAAELTAASDSFETAKEALSEMADSISASVCNFNPISPDASILVEALPRDRAAEIKNGHLFISPDGKYLYLAGYKYEVYDPNVQRTDGPALSPVYDWSVDGVKEISSTDIDVWEGINGFFNSNGVSNLDDEQSAIFNAPMLLLGIFEGIAAGKTTTTIKATFETNQYGERRVIIGLTDSSVQNTFNNWDYSKPSSMYDGCDNVSNYLASSAAEGAYEAITGNTASEKITTQYDVHITLDEEHQYTDYPHYIISFNDEGKAVMTPNYFAGDKIEVTEFTNIMSIATNEHTVYEASLSELFQPTEFDNSELLLNCLMSN